MRIVMNNDGRMDISCTLAGPIRWGAWAERFYGAEFLACLGHAPSEKDIADLLCFFAWQYGKHHFGSYELQIIADRLVMRSRHASSRAETYALMSSIYPFFANQVNTGRCVRLFSYP